MQGAIRIDLSEWRTANIDANGEVIFAVGDVHGCAAQLSALLDVCGELNGRNAQRRRLVFLGDVINRGPATIKALRLWARESPIPGVMLVDRLLGNHEQLLLLATQVGDAAEMARRTLLKCGGDRFLQELRVATRIPSAELDHELLLKALGRRISGMLDRQHKPFIRVGNLLFVHAGLDPDADQDEFLSLRADTLPIDGHHWAWIEERFLKWRGGFQGTVVVHGHVPPRRHYELTGQENPHLLCHSRLGLDGGSAITGIVTGAQIEDGRYRIIRAVND